MSKFHIVRQRQLCVKLTVEVRGFNLLKPQKKILLNGVREGNFNPQTLIKYNGQGEQYYCINKFSIKYEGWVSFRFSFKPHLFITIIANIRMSSSIKCIYMCICFNPRKQTKT